MKTDLFPTISASSVCFDWGLLSWSLLISALIVQEDCLCVLQQAQSKDVVDEVACSIVIELL